MPEKKTYKCFICDKTITTKQNLLLHLSTVEKNKFKHLPDKQEEILNHINALSVRSNHVDAGLKCPYCHKVYKNKYSAKKHITQCSVKVKHSGSTEVEIPPEVAKAALTEPIIAPQLHPGVPVSVINNMTTNNDMKKVKVLLSEDYMPILLEKLGSRQAVYEYLKSCMYRKQAGDLDIFNKIYLEGRSPNYYPVKCLDRKAMRFAFVNKDGLVVEGGDFVFTHISGNVQDCYIQIQNEAIESHLLRGKENISQQIVIHNSQSEKIAEKPDPKPNVSVKSPPDKSANAISEKFVKVPTNDDNGDFLFDQHDVGGWQDHLVEYMDVRYKRKLMQGLGDMLCEKIDEYDGPYLNIGLNYQYQMEELELSPKTQKHLYTMATTKD